MKTSETMVLPLFAALALMGCASDAVPAEAEASQESAAAEANACTDTEIIIGNWRNLGDDEMKIEVDNVDYLSASEGRWQGRALGNVLLEHGQQVTYWNIDLQHAENAPITKWRVTFRSKASAVGTSWSDFLVQEIDTPNTVCRAGGSFYLTLQ